MPVKGTKTKTKMSFMIVLVTISVEQRAYQPHNPSHDMQSVKKRQDERERIGTVPQGRGLTSRVNQSIHAFGLNGHKEHSHDEGRKRGSLNILDAVPSGRSQSPFKSA